MVKEYIKQNTQQLKESDECAIDMLLVDILHKMRTQDIIHDVKCLRYTLGKIIEVYKIYNVNYQRNIDVVGVLESLKHKIMSEN